MRSNLKPPSTVTPTISIGRSAQHERDAFAENEQLQQQIAERDGIINDLLGSDYQKQLNAEQRQAFKDQLLDQLLDTTPGASDRLIDRGCAWPVWRRFFDRGQRHGEAKSQ
jgi:hypothetical protein